MAKKIESLEKAIFKFQLWIGSRVQECIFSKWDGSLISAEAWSSQKNLRFNSGKSQETNWKVGSEWVQLFGGQRGSSIVDVVKRLCLVPTLLKTSICQFLDNFRCCRDLSTVLLRGNVDWTKLLLVLQASFLIQMLPWLQATCSPSFKSFTALVVTNFYKFNTLMLLFTF